MIGDISNIADTYKGVELKVLTEDGHFYEMKGKVTEEVWEGKLIYKI
jgi:hypothetical protein